MSYSYNDIFLQIQGHARTLVYSSAAMKIQLVQETALSITAMVQLQTVVRVLCRAIRTTTLSAVLMQ